MPHRLFLQKGHEHGTVSRIAVAAKFFRIDAIAFAIGVDRLDNPVFHPFAQLGNGIACDTETEFAAQDVFGEAVVGDTDAQGAVVYMHDVWISYR
ncbi:hypothetical protein D3C78_1753570 [compost metagenome]